MAVLVRTGVAPIAWLGASPGQWQLSGWFPPLMGGGGGVLCRSGTLQPVLQGDGVPGALRPHVSPFLPPSGNGKLASWTSILGFVVMMSLDVGLG